ncbi:ABC-2 type transporter [Methanohalobium evestigatum Z-7303]|uniref:ABC-2 type transporter n=1 Tax=Methanohalobium evestigatum (strain ATCC BAA-1072 / DSM 3721 / NBRC 107634 / OCM 161 / Z-7303) TaxID=644295 RepID=D7EAM3_METEZ|nr:ABC transporter permease [Methanohalobium evestigatum]ADI75022.1 ABC-2 type transporter [Methanohalobium evestigatum Z-7303]
MSIMSYFKLPSLSYRVFKVWLRNKDVFMTTLKVNLLPPLLSPLLYLFAIGLGLGTYINNIEGVSYIEFIAPAMIAVSMMYASFFECTFGSYVRMYYQKTFDAIIATPLTIEEVITGEMLWGATRSTINATLVVIIVSIMGLAEYPHSLLIIPFSFISGFLFACLGMCFTAISPNINTLTYPSILFITPMFLFSGTFFPLSLLPQILQYLAYAILPLTHIVMIIRSLTTGSLDIIMLGNFIWIAAASLILFVLSVNLMKKRLIV